MIEHNINIMSPFLKHADLKPATIKKWVIETLAECKQKCSVGISNISINEMQELNKKFRKMDKPTNILAFPFAGSDFSENDEKQLGELVICERIILEEAKSQAKSITDHFAHIIIHGTLHLLGYIHESDDNATMMENKEIEILKKFNIDNPYDQRNI